MLNVFFLSYCHDFPACFTSDLRARPALNLDPLCVCLLPPRFDAPEFVRVLGNRSILLAQGGRHDGMAGTFQRVLGIEGLGLAWCPDRRVIGSRS